MATNNAYENISTCVTLIKDSIDDLQEAILESIETNYVNRFSLLGLERKCSNIRFDVGIGSTIDVKYDIKNVEGEVIRVLTLASIPYNYDITNVFLNYGKNPSFEELAQQEEINKYSVVMCYTMSSTISGFTILSPSSLINNTDGTYSLYNVRDNTASIISFTQNDSVGNNASDNIITYEDILTKLKKMYGGYHFSKNMTNISILMIKKQ